MKEHGWVRADETQWTTMGTENGPIAKQGWFDVPFSCPGCGCVGHAAHKPDGDIPCLPEEAMNPETGEIVDARGDCNEQMVEGVHAY